MALSDAQKAQIRRYLGFPDPGVDTFTELESAMNSLTAAGEAIATELLTDLAAVQTQYDSVRSRAGVERVEDVWFSSADTSGSLRVELRRLVDDLSNLLGIRPAAAASGAGVLRRGA